jgi:hypothetical protein
MAETELCAGELLDALTAERKRQNRIRTMLGSGLFSLFLLFAVAIIVQFQKLDTNHLEFKMNAEASASLWPIVSEQLDDLVPTAIPALDDALALESPHFLPRFNAVLAEEAELFSQQLGKVGDQNLEEALAEAESLRGAQMDAFRSSLHADPAVSDVAFNALIERGQSWARSEMDHLLAEPIGFLEAFHADTTALAEEPLDEKALRHATVVFIEIVNSQTKVED